MIEEYIRKHGMHHYSKLNERQVALLWTDEEHAVKYIKSHIVCYKAGGYCRALLERGYPEDLIIHILILIQARVTHTQFFFEGAYSAEGLYERVIKEYGPCGTNT